VRESSTYTAALGLLLTLVGLSLLAGSPLGRLLLARQLQSVPVR
jgi:hypothetical protein